MLKAGYGHHPLLATRLQTGMLTGALPSPEQDPLQHHPQAHDSSLLAADTYLPLGHRRHADGRRPEPDRLLHRPLLLGRDRVRPLPRRRVLLLHVVQAAGEAVPHLAVLQRGGARGLLRRHPGLREHTLHPVPVIRGPSPPAGRLWCEGSRGRLTLRRPAPPT